MDTAKRRKYGGNLIVLVELDSNNTIPGTITSGTNAIALSCQEESDSPLETSEEILRTEDGLVADVDQEHNAKQQQHCLKMMQLKQIFWLTLSEGKNSLKLNIMV
jgi:precorrin-6B methylase 2